MAQQHIVRAGEWIGVIAVAHGFRHWAELWEHPLNEELRARRHSPDLLMVGDSVAIPGPDDRRGIPVRTGQRVVFQVRARTDVLRLRVAGLGPFIAAFGSIGFVLEVGTEVVEGELTEDPQTIEATLPPTASKAVLLLKDRRRIELVIGGLGPVDEAHGAHARLVNLGYAAPPSLGATLGEPDTTAVMGFQRAHELPLTAVLDQATRGAIARVYGG